MANLVSYDDGVMRVMSGSSAPFARGGTCPQYKKQELVYRNKALMWSALGTNQAARLERVGGIRKEPVSKAMAGEWKMTGEAAGGSEGSTVEFVQGGVRTALVIFNGRGRSETCSGAEVLAAADDGTLVLAGSDKGTASCDYGRLDSAVPMRVTMNGDDEVRLGSFLEPGRRPLIFGARHDGAGLVTSRGVWGTGWAGSGALDSARPFCAAVVSAMCSSSLATARTPSNQPLSKARLVLGGSCCSVLMLLLRRFFGAGRHPSTGRARAW
ncbi:hypothetical protein GTZ89_26400 [Streptomyces sp. SID8382]|nr:hypothetical protein [Streptomyces sp. SID8382]MYX59099.1 hypothetical protein [Streptomyces sp. SID8382]